MKALSSSTVLVTIYHTTLLHRPYDSDIYGSGTVDLPYFYLYISVYKFESTI